MIAKRPAAAVHTGRAAGAVAHASEESMQSRLFIAAVATCLAAPSAAAQQRADSAAFIIRLGVDTTAIERYVRTPDRISIEAVQRSPSTTVHRLNLTTDPTGRITGSGYTITQPGATTPVQTRVLQFQRDTAVITTTQGGTTRTQRVAARDAIPLMGPFYTPYELAITRAVARNAARSEIPLLAGAGVVMIPVERVGRDSVNLNNQFGEPMRARIDAQGRLLNLSTPAFTTVERMRWIDLDALAAEFARRDGSGRGMGPLSPRQTFRTTAAGANLWVDYSRPAKRGRPVWGALVPWGEVWRMGANDAAHFATDRTVQLGELTLQPGTYTLFLLPAADRWQLIVNRTTGISGLDHDPAQDVGRTDMTKETVERPAELFTIQLEEAQGGPRLVVAWDRTRAWVPIRVQ
jgi:hypothetical protein